MSCIEQLRITLATEIHFLEVTKQAVREDTAFMENDIRNMERRVEAARRKLEEAEARS